VRPGGELVAAGRAREHADHEARPRRPARFERGERVARDEHLTHVADARALHRTMHEVGSGSPRRDLVGADEGVDGADPAAGVVADGPAEFAEQFLGRLVRQVGDERDLHAPSPQLGERLGGTAHRHRGVQLAVGPARDGGACEAEYGEGDHGWALLSWVGSARVSGVRRSTSFSIAKFASSGR
jgi:hypothetical protein